MNGWLAGWQCADVARWASQALAPRMGRRLCRRQQCADMCRKDFLALRFLALRQAQLQDRYALPGEAEQLPLYQRRRKQVEWGLRQHGARQAGPGLPPGRGATARSGGGAVPGAPAAAGRGGAQGKGAPRPAAARGRRRASAGRAGARAHRRRPRRPPFLRVESVGMGVTSSAGGAGGHRGGVVSFSPRLCRGGSSVPSQVMYWQGT